MFNISGDRALSLCWQRPIGPNGFYNQYYASVTFAPVMANGVGYAADGYDSTLRAFNAQAGQYLWDDRMACQSIATPICSSPAVVDGMVFIGDL